MAAIVSSVEEERAEECEPCDVPGAIPHRPTSSNSVVAFQPHIGIGAITDSRRIRLESALDAIDYRQNLIQPLWIPTERS